MKFTRFIKELLVIIAKEQKGMNYSSLAYAGLPIPDRLYFVTLPSVPLGGPL